MWVIYDKRIGTIRSVSEEEPALTEAEAEWLAVGEVLPGTESRPGMRFGDPLMNEAEE